MIFLNPIQDGTFQGCSQIGGEIKGPSFLKSDTYLMMMRLGTVLSYLKKIQKYIDHVTHFLNSAGISIFSLETGNFCYIKKYRYRCITS